MEPVLQIYPPNCFRLREVLIINAIAIIPAALLGTAGVLSIFFLIFAFAFRQYLFLLFAAIALSISLFLLFFLPVVINAHAYVRSIVRRIRNGGLVGVSTVCQVSFAPRVHGGFRGFMEDADDVGRLYISNESLNFVGDHIQISLPFGLIKEVRVNNIGWRRLWCGKRVRILTDAFDHYDSIEILERCSNTLMKSHQITQEIISQISRALKGAGK
jgi:hypothetical protein